MIAFLFFIVKTVLGLLWFLLTLGVLVQVWKNESRDAAYKVLWTLGVLAFPILGPVAFMIVNRK